MNTPKDSNDVVVLLHGLGRGYQVMSTLEKYLSKENYQVINIDYPSTQYPLNTLVKYCFSKIKPLFEQDNVTVHFVVYSMGGILLRLLLEKYRPKHLGRVVMLGTPNKGTRVADFLSRFQYFKKHCGSALLEITVGLKNLHHHFRKINYEVGVIAGNRTVDPWFSWFILKGKNDGKVTVKSTYLNGMKDHIVLASSHYFLPRKKIVINQVIYFLKNGCFEK